MILRSVSIEFWNVIVHTTTRAPDRHQPTTLATWSRGVSYHGYRYTRTLGLVATFGPSKVRVWVR